MRMKYLFYIVMALLFLSGCVEPQNFVSLENRVAAIEMENNRQRSKQAAKNNQSQQKFKQDIDSIEDRLKQSASPEEYADIKYNIQTIKENIQRLEGAIEEINHRFEVYNQQDKQVIEKKLERLDQAISKNYEKVIKLEKYMGFEPSSSGDIAGKPVPSKGLEKNSAQELYDFAKKLFDDGDKENARIQFENFINKHPDSDNADNARFWIADSYYSEKWFEKAILEYQRVLEEYPNSNKLAAARLKQGYAFAELGEKANARLILKELLKKHPGSHEAKYAQEKLKNLK
ncbi:MAG: tol-pal system protein YbgF [Desulfobacteraceae bacterium]|nr:tol-pal system protein YbgF [Desulfobacteraceae bacterium]